MSHRTPRGSPGGRALAYPQKPLFRPSTDGDAEKTTVPIRDPAGPIDARLLFHRFLYGPASSPGFDSTAKPRDGPPPLSAAAPRLAYANIQNPPTTGSQGRGSRSQRYTQLRLPPRPTGT